MFFRYRSFLWILWSVYVYGKDIELSSYPLCAFNPLCTCSKGIPDLGIVQCKNVAFPAIPRMINTSKVFMLHMENNELQRLEPYFFQATGLYGLSISSNPISEIPDDAFTGLERSLWELHLTNNHLVDVPTRAIRHLQKLRTLDLSLNQISYIDHESWRGLEDSLEQLILSENSLSFLPVDSFSGLPFLQTLDLSGNNLRDIDGSVFRDGMDKLSRVILSNNLLTRIPYGQVSALRSLKLLDLSHNRIPTMNLADNEYNPGIRLSLDVLHLEYNNLEILQTGSFQFFDVVNQTFLDGNPMKFINDDAFRQAKIRELYLRHCNLDFISPSAFGGLENTLQVLDMSGNNLTSIPEILFQQLFSLKSLGLRENRIKSIIPIEMFNGFQSTLLKLDLSGDTNAITSFQDLKRMRNLRSLAVSKLPKTNLGPEDFFDFGVELENLKISGGNLKSVKSNTFRHIRGIRRLDLSDNAISTLETDAFLEIGHALQSLKMSHSFASSFTTLPRDVLKYLTSLRELDISNNKLKSISDTTFHFLRNLQYLNVQDNQIEQIVKGTFQGDIHSNLETILMGYNSIKYIPQHSFVDLENVRNIILSDNQIEKIERRAFMNLHQLRVLNLRGNKLTSISDEAFQNLPETEIIDLAYNSLNYFDFEFFDQVGTLSTLKVNVSHNKINYLFDNKTFFSPGREYGSQYHSNIKVLDLSGNNITDINGGYFRPVEISLTHLYLNKNNLMNTTRSVLGNLQHLHWLDLSHNQIIDLDYDTFRNTRKLQYIDMSHNRVADLPTELFKYITELRVVDLSNNYIRSLPENLFFDDGLEKLDLSYNWLIKVPVNAMSNVAALTLCYLDLSHNQIATIHNVDLSTKFRSLSYLDLSDNHLLRLEDAAFATLPRLSTLILSNNAALEVTGKVFIGLENSLMDLQIDNVSLMTFPDLPFTFLKRLSISHNELPSIPPDLALNVSSLRHLDLSYNDLSAVPLITHSLPQLKSLNLAGNPISTLTNTSLIGAAETLEVLNIAHLFLNSFELGALSRMSSLKRLIISPYPDVINFNIPLVVEEIETLRQLEIEAPKAIPVAYAGDAGFMRPKGPDPQTDLRLEMDGILPPKLKTVVLRGRGFKQVANNILNGIQSPLLHLVLQNTSITSLPNNFFKSYGNVRNLTLDFTQNNDNLIKIPNPSTGRVPYLPDQVFLMDLRLGNQQLTCDCGLGWVEYWSRKKRQYMCNSISWSSDVFEIFSTSHPLDPRPTSREICENENGLREAECSNKGSQSLIEVLKSELECGWDSSSKIDSEMIIVFSVMAILLVFWF
ncbi:chaoptin [Phlebotomus papatasi]|uniref:chaoptin n=1 Tax=Phlebotomus papatasi TaxID=29031 RepID=UPI002483FE80|nr:chaoptin [Phlebotomus papatasi]